jgi:DnaJ-class molecular chaperone
VDREDFSDLKHAYRVLDVPSDAPPDVIKSSYRKLIKRWHPDLHQPDSEAYIESTSMTKSINDAYGLIKNAPLRNDETWPRDEYVSDPSHDAFAFYRMTENARKAGARDDRARPMDWFGFFVRFLFGVLFGGVVSFEVIVYASMRHLTPSLMYIGIVATILGCGLLSAFGGDAFWRSIRPRGPWWWGRWD